ncbi:unnamed protein product [Rotaria sp. Silwood1]|nr:unnamed protein product [Rotaria sp. Silwood1]CAF3770588.1 unnamed protein product [Rotaria sp. Silwood1]CAF3860540.1 unnamed protein product [Rotaria sp. Silwood1]CAF4813804.1 unnamed protein product [Rotaria sp. Silwood1]CAF4839607.1 unnamed protein product [Rotaria sp. Silwood1]
MYISFSNHLTGQNILYIDVYDEGIVKNHKIGSVEIDLNDLYRQGHIDDWFYIIGDKYEVKSLGEIHLNLHYEKLQV